MLHNRPSLAATRKRFLAFQRPTRGGLGIVPGRWCASIALGVSIGVLGPMFGWSAEVPKKQEPFRYDAKGRRDPFIALFREGRLVNPTASNLQADKPVLYGILWDPTGHSIALINDTEAKVGDTINGYQVTEIRRDAVVLSVEGGEPVVLQITFDTPPGALAPRTTTGGRGR